ncbi:MAG: restriction endonuclease subunit S [Ramlibacter sp.]|nr:restriction endonuclease subunit S [Ramlibacter sp.]
MNGWAIEKLATLVNVVYGKSPAEVKKLDDGFPIFGTGGVVGYTSDVLCDGPSVILGRKGTIDKVQRCAGPFWAIDTTYFTTAKRVFDWSWLYYAISSLDLRKLNEASGVPSLSRSSLEALDVATPPLPEQRKIAAILSAVDDKLDVIARQIEATQALKQGLMQTLFSRGVGTQDAAGEWVPHTEFKRTSSQSVPATWHARRLGDIAPLIRRPVEIDPNTTYPELGLRSYGKGTFHKPALMGAEVGNKRLFQIKGGDLLFSNVFAWEGAVAVALPEDDGRYGSHRYITCAVDATQADTVFLHRYLTTPTGIALLTLASPGGAGRNKTLGLGALADIEVPLPPLNEQRKISQILDGVEAKLRVLNSKREATEALKRGLMQKLLTGEWRVKVEAELAA